MAAKRSAAMLLYRVRSDRPMQVLIAHLGGPFWARKDEGAWSIPKGEYLEPEQPLAAAQREFEEEMGSPPPPGPYLELGDTHQPSGKIVTTFAVEGDFDLTTFISNTFPLEWPRGSGRIQQFPELDRAAWVEEETAAVKLVRGQLPILQALRDALGLPAAGGQLRG